MKILVSNEFYELFRGDKDFIIPRLIAQKLGHQVFILCPTKLSLSDQNAGFAFSGGSFRSSCVLRSGNRAGRIAIARVFWATGCGPEQARQGRAP